MQPPTSSGNSVPPSKPLTDGETLKACLFNLIIYTHEPRRTHYFQEVAKMIMPTFPCRIIFIQLNLASTDREVHIHTAIRTNPERGIVCDQISIEASSQSIDRVYFLLFSLLIPDLPIYLLWGQDPTKAQTLLPRLQRLASRLIFDSEATDNLQQFSRDMLTRLANSSIPIVDMNWARIGGWREVLAQTFDSQARFDQLRTATEITVTFNDRPSEVLLHPDTRAIYLQAWLASRLGWQWQRSEPHDQGHKLIYQSTEGSHVIQLLPQSDDRFESEEVLGVEICSSDYACHLKRISADRVRVQASNQIECALPFTLLMPTLRSGRGLMQEIFYQKISNQYEPTLKLINLGDWSTKSG